MLSWETEPAYGRVSDTCRRYTPTCVLLMPTCLKFVQPMVLYSRSFISATGLFGFVPYSQP